EPTARRLQPARPQRQLVRGTLGLRKPLVVLSGHTTFVPPLSWLAPLSYDGVANHRSGPLLCELLPALCPPQPRSGTLSEPPPRTHSADQLSIGARSTALRVLPCTAGPLSTIQSEVPMRDETAFLQALLANPANDSLRLVYADWLEEQNGPA